MDKAAELQRICALIQENCNNTVVRYLVGFLDSVFAKNLKLLKPVKIYKLFIITNVEVFPFGYIGYTAKQHQTNFRI